MCNYDPQEGDPLTHREVAVYRLLVKGMTYDDIALSLFITKRTVHFHSANICKKKGVPNRLKLMVLHYNKMLENAKCQYST